MDEQRGSWVLMIVMLMQTLVMAQIVHGLMHRGAPAIHSAPNGNGYGPYHRAALNTSSQFVAVAEESAHIRRTAAHNVALSPSSFGGNFGAENAIRRDEDKGNTEKFAGSKDQKSAVGRREATEKKRQEDEGDEEEHIHGGMIGERNNNNNGTGVGDGEQKQTGDEDNVGNKDGEQQNKVPSAEFTPHEQQFSASGDAPFNSALQYSTVPNFCSDDENATFLRHQWLPSQSSESGGPKLTAANFVRKMDSLEACARLCRDNIEPFDGRPFGCHGFTYIGRRNARNSCEFFDDHLAAPLEKKPPLGAYRDQFRGILTPQFPKNYFERICLTLPPRCVRLPFAFEVHPRNALAIPGNAKSLLAEQMDDRKRCLQRCLGTKGCRSLDYDTANLTCTLYTHSQHATLGALEESMWRVGQLIPSADVDHYENTCLTELDRCGTRHLAFILIRDAELAGFSVALGRLTVGDCLARCLDSPPAFCRSVQFRAQSGECFLGTEQPFSPVPSDDMDIFEPICLPDPPQTSTLECLGEHVFERVPNMELRMDTDEQSEEAGAGTQWNGGTNGTELSGLSLEYCLDACILDESCVSLIYRPSTDIAGQQQSQHGNNNSSNSNSQCWLLPFGRGNNRTLPVIHPSVDYYELSCNRIRIPSPERTTPPETNREEAVREKDGRRETTTMTTKGAEVSSTIVSNDVNGFEKSGNTMGSALFTGESDKFHLDSVLAPSTSSILTTQIGSIRSLSSLLTFFTSTLPTPTPSPSSSFSTSAIPPESSFPATFPPFVNISTNCTATGNSSLLERGRTLRLEQRQQHHVNVREGAQCERLCANAKAIRCRTFAYSQRTRDCLLTASRVGGREQAEYLLLTQPNPNFELYSFLGGARCGAEPLGKTAETVTDGDGMVEALNIVTSSDPLLKSLEVNDQFRPTTASFPTLVFGDVFQQHQTTAMSGPSLLVPSVSEQPIEEQIRTATSTSTVPIIHQNPLVPTTQIEAESIPDLQQKTETSRHIPITTPPWLDQTTSSSQIRNEPHSAGGGTAVGVGPWMAPPPPTWPPQPPASQQSPASALPLPAFPDNRLGLDQIRAGVLCDPQGLNVTFQLIPRYSGVIYAADRYAHCRLFVEDAAEFAFYVNRPINGLTNWCNSLEIDGELSVVLVLSNDEVLPLDVTTGDDLFFHFSCDYRTQRHSQQQGVWPGSISGPEPGPLFAGKRPTKAPHPRRPLAEPELDQKQRGRVRLKILREGRPVNSVYIGERLSAVVESVDVEVYRLRVGECNATRVGGRVPQPSSIPLLDRAGCSLNPHIIGHMQRRGERLEAPLSAFHIDGSDEIDIVCMVLVCRTRCAREPTRCEGPTARAKRTGNIKLGSPLLIPLSDPEQQQDTMRVDQRIRVLVSEEEERMVGEDMETETVEESRVPEAEAGEGGQNTRGGGVLLLDGMASTGASGDICLNPLALLSLLVLLLLTLSALFISLFAHWCRRKSSRHHNFYPASSTFSTELSSHHFHIPRVHDRNSYVG